LTSHYLGRQYHYVSNDSGVGVIDKAVAILEAAAGAPTGLTDLVARTGISRATAHRLARALEVHGLLGRDGEGRFVLGPRVFAWSSSSDPLHVRAGVVVTELRDTTGVSAQVYLRVGDARLCIAAAEPVAGLRDTVPVGSLLTLKAGSAAQVLTAWLPSDQRSVAVRKAAFTAEDLAEVRRRGWAHSIGQREPGVASVSAPVYDDGGAVVAAVSLSGPIDRLRRPAAARIRALLSGARSLAH